MTTWARLCIETPTRNRFKDFRGPDCIEQAEQYRDKLPDTHKAYLYLFDNVTQRMERQA